MAGWGARFGENIVEKVQLIMIRKVLLAGVFALVMATGALCADIQVVTEEWPPYNCVRNGRIEGIVTEVVKATLEQAGVSYDIEAYPWARAYEMARTGENVLIYSILKLPNRAAHFKWIKIDGLAVEMALFRPKYRKDINLESLDDAKKYRIGVTRATSTHHFLLSQGFVEGANLFPVNSEDLNLHKSEPSTRRIDLTTGDPLSLARWLKMSGLPSDYWVRTMPLFERPIYMAFGLNTSDAVIEKIRQALEEIQAQGKVAAILQSYRELFEVQDGATGGSE